MLDVGCIRMDSVERNHFYIRPPLSTFMEILMVLFPPKKAALIEVLGIAIMDEKHFAGNWSIWIKKIKLWSCWSSPILESRISFSLNFNLFALLLSLMSMLKRQTRLELDRRGSVCWRDGFFAHSILGRADLRILATSHPLPCCPAIFPGGPWFGSSIKKRINRSYSLRRILST